MRVVLLLVPLLTGCLSELPAIWPMRPMTSVRTQLPITRAKCLVIFLPGVKDDSGSFTTNGFVARVAKHHFAVEMISADASFAYYARGKVLERLGKDVIKPAQARGFRETWIIGVSMGGLGALLYARAHPQQITGVLALSPYLGKPDLVKEIAQAGGLAAWPEPERTNVLNADNYERELWGWLKAVSEKKETAPLLYLGWGTEDLLRDANELLGAALPQERTIQVQGGHNWATWEKALEVFLTNSEFSRNCR